MMATSKIAHARAKRAVESARDKLTERIAADRMKLVEVRAKLKAMRKQKS
jgi:hypothetical protein